MTVNPPVGYTAVAFRIDAANPIWLHLGLINVFQVVRTLNSREINSQLARVLSRAWVVFRAGSVLAQDTFPGANPVQWRLAFVGTRI